MKTSEEIDKEWKELSEEYDRIESDLKICAKKMDKKWKEWADAVDRENEETLEKNTP